MPISLPAEICWQFSTPKGPTSEASAPLMILVGQDSTDLPEYDGSYRLALSCPENICSSAAQALASQLPALLSQHSIDPDRLYLIVQPGGHALARQLLSRMQEVFAALIWAGQLCPQDAALVSHAIRRQSLWLLIGTGEAAVHPSLEALGWKEGWDYFASQQGSDLIRRWLLAQSRSLPPLPEHPGRPAVITPEMQPLVEQMARARAARTPYLSRFLPGSISAGCRNIHYQLYVPDHCATGQRYPLVLFLHGIGECGSDHTAPLLASDGGLVWVKAQDQGEIGPCFVLVPQCPWPIPGFRWEPEYLAALGQLLTALQREYPIDSRRLYATGLSLGGFGVWNLQKMFPGRFAALVSCCPACLKGTFWNHTPDLDALEGCAQSMGKTPLWLFHAQDDPEVPVEISKTMAQRLRSGGNHKLHLTIYPAEAHWGHACWNPAFSDPALLRWLMDQALPTDS